LPGGLKRGKRVKDLKHFLAKHIKFLPGSLKKKKIRSNLSKKISRRTHLRGDKKNNFLRRTHHFFTGAKHCENTYLSHASRRSFQWSIVTVMLLLGNWLGIAI